jgi:DnaD/phage-associated family protein
MAVGDSYFFSHDIDALSDIKISALCSEFGFEAYGLFWVCLEHMFPEECLSLPYSDMTFIAIKRQTNTSCDVKAFVDRAVEYGLFERDGDMFFSPSFVSRMAKIDSVADARSEQARKAANARWQKRRENNAPDADAMQGQCSSNAPAMHEHNAPDADAMLIDANEMKRNEIYRSSSSAHAREDDPLSEVIQLYVREIDPIPSTVVIAHLDMLVNQGMEPEVMLYAINEAASANVRNWNYVRKVLDNLKKDKVLTMEAVAQRERKFQASKGKKQGDKRDNRGNFSTGDDYDYNDGEFAGIAKLRIEGQA